MADEPTPSTNSPDDTQAPPRAAGDRSPEQAIDDAQRAAEELARHVADGGAENESASNHLDLPPFQPASFGETAATGIDMLGDVDLNVKIELGRTHMLVEDVLRLTEGSVVELDKLAGDPVDVYVNDRLVARGEVLVLNDNFCVRVNEIVAAADDEAEIATEGDDSGEGS